MLRVTCSCHKGCHAAPIQTASPTTYTHIQSQSCKLFIRQASAASIHSTLTTDCIHISSAVHFEDVIVTKGVQKEYVCKR